MNFVKANTTTTLHGITKGQVYRVYKSDDYFTSIYVKDEVIEFGSSIFDPASNEEIKYFLKAEQMVVAVELDRLHKKEHLVNQDLDEVEKLINLENMVKQGTFWYNMETDKVYVLTAVGYDYEKMCNTYSLINIREGTRWCDAHTDIQRVFGGEKKHFKAVKVTTTIN